MSDDEPSVRITKELNDVVIRSAMRVRKPLNVDKISSIAYRVDVSALTTHLAHSFPEVPDIPTVHVVSCGNMGVSDDGLTKLHLNIRVFVPRDLITEYVMFFPFEGKRLPKLNQKKVDVGRALVEHFQFDSDIIIKSALAKNKKKPNGPVPDGLYVREGGEIVGCLTTLHIDLKFKPHAFSLSDFLPVHIRPTMFNHASS